MIEDIADQCEFNSSTNFKDFAEWYLLTTVKVDNAQQTYRAYSMDLRCHIYPVMAHLELGELSVKQADQLKLNMIKKGKMPRGMRRAFGCLNVIINKAVDRRIIEANPFARYKLPKVGKQRAIYWRLEEIQQFIKANKQSDDSIYLPIFIAAMETGMRKGELLGLTWNSINFDTMQISVTRTRTPWELKDKTKSGNDRFIPITPMLMTIFQLLLKRRKKERMVFLGRDGKEVNFNTLTRAFHRCRNRAGVSKIRFHDMRHSFASHFMMKRGNIFDLRDVLGHANLKMTERYAHLDPSHLLTAIPFMGTGLDDCIGTGRGIRKKGKCKKSHSA